MQHFLQGKYKTIVRQKTAKKLIKIYKMQLFDKIRLVDKICVRKNAGKNDFQL